MMKRYNIHGIAASQGKELKNQPYTAYEDPDGLWVAWEDAKDIMKRNCDLIYENGDFKRGKTASEYQTMKLENEIERLRGEVRRLMKVKDVTDCMRENKARIQELLDEVNEQQLCIIDQQNEIRSLKTTTVTADDGTLKVKDATECNCEKAALDAGKGDWWICPKHGYKKR